MACCPETHQPAASQERYSLRNLKKYDKWLKTLGETHQKELIRKADAEEHPGARKKNRKRRRHKKKNVCSGVNATEDTATEQCSTLANEPDESQAELMAAASMPQDVSPDPLFPQCQDIAHASRPAAMSLDNLCIHSKAETRREEQVEKDRDEDIHGSLVGSSPETFKEGPFEYRPPDVCSGTSSVGLSKWKSTSVARADILGGSQNPSLKGPPEDEPDIGGTVVTGTSGYVSNFSGHLADDQHSASLKNAGQSTSKPACVVVTNIEGMEPVRIQLKPDMSSCSDLVIEIQNLPRYSELSTKPFTLHWQDTGEAVRVTDTFGSGEHRLVVVEAPEGGDWLWRM